MTTFLFNFKPQFADRVALGEMLQTIRQTRRDGKVPRSGDVVKLYTGLRTHKAQLLAVGVVFDCFNVQMDFENRLIVSNGVRLNPGEMNSFARLDGFETGREMLDWFHRTYHGESFEGFCCRWSLREHLWRKTECPSST